LKNKVQVSFGGKKVKVKVELNCPTKGISRVEINTPKDFDYITSGLCGNTVIKNDGFNCSLHYELATGERKCSNSSELLGKQWILNKNINWQIDLQVNALKKLEKCFSILTKDQKI
jgi:hypothetical protein